MKKIIAIALTLVLALGLFAGCGSKADEKTIVVAASPTPHAEILEAAKEVLAAEGYTLEVKVFTDYVQPNTATEDGEVDANYFQHVPYLSDFNTKNGTHLVPVLAVHYEPFGIYPGTKTDLADIAEGDIITIPNDGSNRARALMLLEAQGLITLKEGRGMEATVLDIEVNELNLDIKEMEAAQLPNTRDSAAFAVINGNYALGAGLNVSTDALASEDVASTSATTYANVLVVKEGNEESAKVQALVKALQDEAVKSFIADKCTGAVVALS